MHQRLLPRRKDPHQIGGKVRTPTTTYRESVSRCRKCTNGCSQEGKIPTRLVAKKAGFPSGLSHRYEAIKSEEPKIPSSMISCLWRPDNWSAITAVVVGFFQLMLLSLGDFQLRTLRNFIVLFSKNNLFSSSAWIFIRVIKPCFQHFSHRANKTSVNILENKSQFTEKVRYTHLQKMENSVQVPKFDGKNFASWKFRIVSILEGKELDDLLEGDPPKDEVKFKEWKKKDAQAKGIITCAMTDSLVALILNCKTSKDIWIALHERYEGDKKKKIIEARNDVSRLIMKKEENWEEYLYRSEKLLEQARNLGAEIEDQEFTTSVIRRLPQKYNLVALQLNCQMKETKLNHNLRFNIKGHTTLRKDRPGKFGGGLAVLIKTPEIKFKEIAYNQKMAAALQKIDLDPEQQLYTPKIGDIAAAVMEMHGDI
ncbi:hypothetical protein LAZ67_17000434 [Cordylochernes scorpioides]|uniref:Uncharacterized protein n=1 Tax=Cordylochernes scorpioides TaxID=51811 RepID=A0ABY6LFF8_9ARAC|nr:hypothetical protein LAZ67_17000434 [Cordylochernes scorpioides]